MFLANEVLGPLLSIVTQTHSFPSQSSQATIGRRYHVYREQHLQPAILETCLNSNFIKGRIQFPDMPVLIKPYRVFCTMFF
jgi:hypothetical protein